MTLVLEMENAGIMRGNEIGAGSYGEVYAVQNRDNHCIKIYEITDAHQQKLRTLLTLSPLLLGYSKYISFPVDLVKHADTNEYIGYYMVRFKLENMLRLKYDLNNGKWHGDIDDRRALRYVFESFTVLHALHQRSIVVGDISDTNWQGVKIDNEYHPAVIDVDSFHLTYHGHPSESKGTNDYVDPRVASTQESDRGGYRFNAETDIFALTILMFIILIGEHPYKFNNMDLNDPNRYAVGVRKLMEREVSVLHFNNNNTVKNIQMANTGDAVRIQNRIQHIATQSAVAGDNFGSTIVQHFHSVFVDGVRTHPVNFSPTIVASTPLGLGPKLPGTAREKLIDPAYLCWFV